MALGNFGDMSGTAAGIGATSGQVSKAMRELSVADMVTSIATGIAKAQSALDDAGIEQFKKMAATTLDIGDRDANGQPKLYNMLQLGFTPHFYFFQKVTIEVSFELKFHFEEEEKIALGAKLNVGGNIEASKSTAKTQEALDNEKADATAKNARVEAARTAQTQRDTELTAAREALTTAETEKTAANTAYTAAESAWNSLPDKDLAALATAADTARTANAADPPPVQNVIDANNLKIAAHDRAKTANADFEAAKTRKTKADADVPVAQKKAADATTAKTAADKELAAAEAAASVIAIATTNIPQ